MRLKAQAVDTGAANPSSPVQFLLDLQLQFRLRRRYELLSCIVGLLGVALMLVENEIVQNNRKKAPNSELMVLILKTFVSVSTVLLDTLLVLRYRCDGCVNQLQSSAPLKRFKFSVSRPFILLLELAVCSFHVPPGISGELEITQLHGAPSAEDSSVCEPLELGILTVRRGNFCYLVYQYPVEVFGVFMVSRLYLFARFVRSLSALHSPWISLVGSLNGVDAMKPFFHFKAIFKLHPLNVLLPLTVLDTLLTAAIVRVLERPVQAAFDNYWKSMWFTIVTLSGTGFGDYYPVTYLGRAFTVAGGMFCGVLIVALIQSLFFNFLDLSPSEKKVRYLIELEWWEKATRKNAAKLLQAAWRSGSLRRGSDLGDQRHLFSVIRRARSLRIEKPTIELSVEDQVAEMETAVLAEVDKMEAQKMQILKRIQVKATKLAALKEELTAKAPTS